MIEGGKSLIVFPQYTNVVMHSTCYEEIIGLVSKDEVPAFIASYNQRIAYLNQHLGEEIFHRRWFEVLKNAHGLRSIRFMKFHNLRILYALDNHKAFLLLAFAERQGHKNTEYSKYIEPALKRFNERENML